MEILIRNDSPKTTLDEAKMKSRTKKILSALGCEETELSLWITTDEEITNIHKEYFGINETTNVISFAQREGKFSEIDPEMLGDIIISYETATKDALEAGKAPEDEIAFLIIHATLHLLGYDHVGKREKDAPEMEAKEEVLYKMLMETKT
jgi:probable rRNA maturation factor